jgi:SAM-dependent methyltransferase
MSLPWYDHSPSPTTQELGAHRNQRDQAWEVTPYPCIGEFAFLDFNLCSSPSYPKIVAHLKSNASVRHLDVGCCLGQDIRKLVLDGVPSSQITGLELEQTFIDLGFSLFKDKDHLKTKFLKANILTDVDTLSQFEGKMSSIYIGMVLVLFNYEEQKTVLRNLLKILVDDGTGILVGNTVGHKDGLAFPGMMGKMTQLHNLETWKKLWKEVEEETGFMVKTWEDFMHISPEGTYGWRAEDRNILGFEVTKSKA